MLNPERRRLDKEASIVLKRLLNEAQRITLGSIENFGWELRFVRRPPGAEPIPVVFDHSGQTYAVLEPDGSLNQTPTITIRPER